MFLPDSLPLYNIAKAVSDSLHWVSFRRTLIYDDLVTTSPSPSWTDFLERISQQSGQEMTSFVLNPQQTRMMLQPGSHLNDLSEEQQLFKTLLTADPQISKTITNLLDSQGIEQPVSFFQVPGSGEMEAGMPAWKEEMQAAMEQYTVNLMELQNMGFTDMMKNKTALATSMGDLEVAIRILTENA